MKIPITKPCLDQTDKDNVLKPLENGWIVQGPFVKEFEKSFSDFTNASHSIATTSCTTALHLALAALNIGPSDKVVVPSFTWVSSANAVEYTGAKCVFCDINLNTFNIDAKKLKQILDSDTNKSIKAIMPVHLFGLCADMMAIKKLAHQYNLKIVEDAACAFGAKISNQHAGTFGDAGCFSFHPRKTITTGEGGMVTTNNSDLATKLSQLRDHGASITDLERHKQAGPSCMPSFDQIGYNYRLTDIQGALGCSQMKKADWILKQRFNIANLYNEAFQNQNRLHLPFTPIDYTHGYQAYVCLYTEGCDINQLNIEQIETLNIKRNAFMQSLADQGVTTRPGTHAIHTLGYYQKKYSFNKTDFLKSLAADRLSIALPLYPGMTQIELQKVIELIKT